MVKYFCDKCEAEITPANECIRGNVPSRLGTEITFGPGGIPQRTLRVELMHTYNGTANDGIFCKYCILDAFRRLDDRPRHT